MGLVVYCTLVDSFGKMKNRGKRGETRHARRVRVKYVEYLSIDGG